MLVGIVEFLGWFGAVTVLAGYLLFSLGKIPNGPLYQLLNLVGGLSVAVNVAAHHAIPSTIVNGIWAVIAVVVLVRMARARRTAERGAAEPTGAPAPVTLHTEPAATTAVLPIVGPALRDHEAEAGDVTGGGSRLQTGTSADATAEADATAGADATASTGAAASADAAASTEATASTDASAGATTRSTDTETVPAAPMTESLPVITATIALALVAAAQQHVEHAAEEHAAHPAGERADHVDEPAEREHATRD